ncbi:hypothetical protein C0Q70_15993 [Pomacea canaliculata]|uniref:polo kinase n=1 Tax=Pomacea canaliculata TaxID=400727 RepID=A0A2T7NNI1_POMCA|nr:hypothetical protein C0Q70_15993 [Pomacea canaliculata]
MVVGKHVKKDRQGGFARCYELLSLKTYTVYAGKIISKSRICKPHQKQKILREVDLQRDLKHRNVVEFISYFEDDDNVYIILENCSRKSLVHVLKHRKCLTEPEVRYYMQQLVEGVQYVHGHRIIHRDLKLGNMLLNENMDLKLADFGLATRVDFEGERKMTVCGTPNYIAPEVLQKKGHSFEADIWAVGCIIPMSYAFPNESRSDPMGRLGNALSQMQLNSCSENLLEEKELEVIEKRSTRQSPVSDSHTPTVKLVSKEVTSDIMSIDSTDSPHQREQSKQGSAAVLLDVLSSCLDHMPKDCRLHPSPVIDSNIVWVTKWVDYSNKYGFGFQLSNDALGVLFNDTSRILMSPDGRSIQYCDLTGKLTPFTLDSVPDELDRKTTLLQYFARYMDEHLIQGGDLECSQHSDPGWPSSLYLKKWFRTTKAIVLYLSDGTLQVNFFEDHTKLILSHVKSDFMVTFIDPARCAKTYNLCHIIHEGCQADIVDRMAFARSMLKNLVDIEGADI